MTTVRPGGSGGSSGGGGGAVASVNGQAGAVVLGADDIAEGATHKFLTTSERAAIAAGSTQSISTVTGLQSALDAKAPLASPTFTGTVAGPRFVGQVVTVTYAASITLDATTGSTFRVSATGPLAVADIINGTDGQQISLEVFASGGDRSVTFAGTAAQASAVPVLSGTRWSAGFRYNAAINKWVLATASDGSAADVIVAPAAYLYEAWTGSDGASWPARWGQVLNNGTADILANSGRHVTDTPVNSTVESTLTGVTVADGELLYRWQWIGNGGVVRVNDLRFRSTDNTNDNCYIFGTSNGGSSLSVRVADVQTTLVQQAWTPQAGVWYWVRVQFTSSQLSARWWADGAAEPTDWMLSTTDSTFVSGLVTVSTQNNNTTVGAFTTVYDDLHLWVRSTGAAAAGITSINGVDGPAVTLVAGSNITLTPNTSTDQITITSSATGGTEVTPRGIYLDSYSGTDDAKLTSAIADQQAVAGLPPIVLGARNHTFNQTRNLYSGLKLVGSAPSGPKNLELGSSNYVTSRVTLGSSITSAASSWWVGGGSNVYDVYMADFAVAGNAGSSVHQFLDWPVSAGGSLYACEFRSLSFNFMRAVIGRSDRPCALTQVLFTGHWTANNLWDTQFTLGGSDNSFWMSGYVNMGPSSSTAQTGTIGSYEVICSSLSNTNVGYLYMTALNGWRGLRITGSGGNGLFFYGGVYEGYKGNTTSLTAGPAPGTVIRIEGGSGAFYGPNVGQAMNNPDATEGGYIHMTGGEWSIFGATFYRGLLADTVPVVYQTGGRLLVTGATRRQNETWTTRPKCSTTATGPNSTQTSFYCPDQSLVP